MCRAHGILRANGVSAAVHETKIETIDFHKSSPWKAVRGWRASGSDGRKKSEYQLDKLSVNWRSKEMNLE